MFGRLQILLGVELYFGRDLDLGWSPWHVPMFSTQSAPFLAPPLESGFFGLSIFDYIVLYDNICIRDADYRQKRADRYKANGCCDLVDKVFFKGSLPELRKSLFNSRHHQWQIALPMHRGSE